MVQAATACLILLVHVYLVAFSECLTLERLAGTAMLPVADLIADIPISQDNPFFSVEEGAPYLTELPAAVHDALMDAGCTFAWRRQQHKTSSPLDAACTAIVRPFLFSSPGALLGTLDGLVNSETFLEDAQRLPHAFVTTADVINFDGGAANASLNLSSLGWSDPSPPILEPLAGYTLEDMYALSAKGGGAPEAFIVHVAGVWSFDIAGGSHNATDEANLVAWRHCVELW